MEDIDLVTNWSQMAISSFPNEAAFYQTLASLHYKAGRKSDAVSTQEKAVAIARSQAAGSSNVQSYIKNLEAMQAGRYRF